MSTPSIKHPDLHAEIVAYCRARGIKPSRFGQDALGDPAFIRSLERGRELRRGTIAAVRRYMVTGEPRQRDAEGVA